MALLDWLKNRQTPIAVDIGTDSIRMLQLSLEGSEPVVAHAARWRFPDAAADPNRRRELTIAALRDMIREGKFVGRHAVSALSCGDMEIKNVRLPQMPPSEMDQAVRFEAKERFQFGVESDQLNYLNAGETRAGTEIRDEIILLAAESHSVQRHVSLLEEARLEPCRIDAECCALYRGFDPGEGAGREESAGIVVLDIGRRLTRVVVGRPGQIVFIKAIDIGADRLNSAVGKHMNVMPSEAAELRAKAAAELAENTPGASGIASWPFYDVLRAEVENLAREVALCLRYCSVTFRGLRHQNLTIVGGQSNDAAVVKLLKEFLNTECVVGRPLGTLAVAPDVFALSPHAANGEWAVCAGLALDELGQGVRIRGSGHEPNRLSA
jgi:type IV pilus assembly protein PilM